MALVEAYFDLLGALEDDRCTHSLSVGGKVAAVADLVAPSLRADLVAAAVLHDVGYGHVNPAFMRWMERAT